MRPRQYPRLVTLLSAAVLALSAGTASQAMLIGLPATLAGSCATNLSLAPGGSNPNVLSDGIKSVAYGEDLGVSGGGGPIYFWQITAGALPPGMTLESDGTQDHPGADDDTNAINGTPTAVGSYSFTITVADWPGGPNTAHSCPAGDAETYQINVHAPGQVTIVLDTQPNTGVDVPFAADWGAFVLDEGPAGSLPRQHTFHVMPDTYVVRETDPMDWGYELTAINCTTGQVYDLAHRKMTILVQDESTNTCTFVNVFRRVDLEIAKGPNGPFKGNNLYAKVAKPTQTQSRPAVGPGTYHYYVRIGNDGPQRDNFRIKGTNTGSAKFGVRYFYNGTDVTGAVKHGTWQTGDLLHGQSVILEVRVVEQPGAPAGAKSTVLVHAGSVGRLDQVDFVRAITTR